MDDQGFLQIIGLIGLFVILGLLLQPRGRKKRSSVRRSDPWYRPAVVQPAAPPANAIVVDGSNVMHWGPEPSAKVLIQVLRSLERAGYAPIVFFDANAGYILDDRYYNQAELAALIGVTPAYVYVVDRGVVADERILSYASGYRLRVVTSDRYRDWRVRFPYAAQKGVLLGGTWREGMVVWHGKLGSQVVSA